MIFFLLGCSQKTFVTPPKQLTKEVPHPKAPKTRAWIHKDVAEFLLEYKKSLGECNNKLKAIKNFYKEK